MADVRTEAMPRGGEFPLLEARRFQLRIIRGRDDLSRKSKPCKQR